MKLAFYVEKEVIRMLFVIPEVEKPIKIIDTELRNLICTIEKGEEIDESSLYCL